jgi:hypothetical protein
VKALEDFTQGLVREAEHVRDRFFLYKVAPELADETWSSELRHKTRAAAAFVEKTKWYRQYFRALRPVTAESGRNRHLRLVCDRPLTSLTGSGRRQCGHRTVTHQPEATVSW